MSGPRIQYAKTADGVTIACADVGEGRPVVLMPFPPMSWLAGWPLIGAVWAALTESYRVAIYDSRGCGLSDRDATDFSLDAMLRDLDAATARLGPDPFALVAVTNAVPIAVTFAASHPGKVSHLIICDGWTDVSDYAGSPVHAIEASVRGKDWTLFAETYARILWGVDDPALAQMFTQWMQASCTPEAYQACYTALTDVSAPTLVIHNRKNRWVPPPVGQRIAADIRGARSVPARRRSSGGAGPDPGHRDVHGHRGRDATGGGAGRSSLARAPLRPPHPRPRAARAFPRARDRHRGRRVPGRVRRAGPRGGVRLRGRA